MLRTIFRRLFVAAIATAIGVQFIIAGFISLVAFGPWEIEHHHLATRSLGFIEQQVDRSDGLGTRILQFTCSSGRQNLWFSLNQVSESELLVVTCDDEQMITDIPWWWPFIFVNLPPAAASAEDGFEPETRHWRDEA